MQPYADIYSLQSSFAVNKYLHTVGSVGFLFTFNYDARNHELKKKIRCFDSHDRHISLCAYLKCNWLQMMMIIKTEVLMFY